MLRWYWLRHYHRTRAHVGKIRREVSKVAMGHAADPIHDYYRGVDAFAFHEEHAKFDSGIDEALLNPKGGPQRAAFCALNARAFFRQRNLRFHK